MFGYTYHGYHHDDVVHRHKFAMGTKERLMASLYVIRGRDVGNISRSRRIALESAEMRTMSSSFTIRKYRAIMH